MIAITHVDQLLAFHDISFVEVAYATILGRPADSEGKQFYSMRLRSGVSKSHIICELAESDEAKKYASGLAGLQDLIRTMSGPSSRGIRSLMPRIARIEQQGNRLENELGRLVELLVGGEKLPGEYDMRAERYARGSKLAAALGIKVDSKVASSAQYEDVSNLSSHARHVLAQLKAAPVIIREP